MGKWMHLDYLGEHGSSVESDDLLRRLEEGQHAVNAALIEFWVENLPVFAEPIDPVNYPGVSVFAFEEELIPFDLLDSITVGLWGKGLKSCGANGTSHRAIILGADEAPQCFETWFAIYVEKSVKGFKPAAA